MKFTQTLYVYQNLTYSKAVSFPGQHSMQQKLEWSLGMRSHSNSHHRNKFTLWLHRKCFFMTSITDMRLSIDSKIETES